MWYIPLFLTYTLYFASSFVPADAGREGRERETGREEGREREKKGREGRERETGREGGRERGTGREGGRERETGREGGRERGKEKERERVRLGVAGWLLVLVSAAYDWYLVTEGQVFPLFSVMLVAMFAVLLWRCQQGMMMDCNGRYLLSRFMLALAAVGVWVWVLWSDRDLRIKYPGWLYVPEPWSYVSLYIMKL